MTIIDSLIADAEAIIEMAEGIQTEELEEEDRKRILKEVNNFYQEWYRRSIRFLANIDRKDIQSRLENEYLDGKITPKIQGFLIRGWMLSLIPQPNTKPSLFHKWQIPFDTAFKKTVLTQCSVLALVGDNFTIEPAIEHDLSSMPEEFKQLLADIQNSSIETSFKDIILYDLNQARLSFEAQAYKASIIMLGAALEGLMLAIITNPKVITLLSNDPKSPSIFKRISQQVLLTDLSNEIPKQMRFEDLKAIITYLIPDIEKLKIEGIQTFRNAVHPWKSVSEPKIYASPNRTRAILHVSSIILLNQYILDWLSQQ